ncbi:MAG TPA: hypothetical protein VGK73_11650 [Polyangiaceae bacterium]
MTRADAETMADFLLAIDRNLELAREIRDRCAEPEYVAELVEKQVQQLTVIRFAVAELKGE